MVPIFLGAMIFLAFLPVLKSDVIQWGKEGIEFLEKASPGMTESRSTQRVFSSQNKIDGVYSPLTVFSFEIERHFFKYNPFVLHLDNLLLHALVTFLVFRLAAGLGLSTPGAGATALFFGIHPIHVETVAWMAARKELLCALFYVAALLCYLGYLNARPLDLVSARTRKPWGLLAVTTFCGVLSLLAHPLALSLPFVLLLLDYYRDRKGTRSVFLEKLPLAGILGFIVLVSSTGRFHSGLSGILEIFLVWVWEGVFYLRQMAVPLFFTPIYQTGGEIGILNPEYFLSVIVAVLVCVAVWRFRRKREIVFSALFYAVTLFPTLIFHRGENPVGTVADHGAYLPGLGFFFLLGASLDVFLRFKKRALKSKLIPKIMGAGGVFFITMTALMTYHQGRVWENAVSLWRHELSIYPDEHTAMNHLANALREKSEFKEAEEEYKKVMGMESEIPPAGLSETTMKKMSRVDYLIHLYSRAIEVNPQYIEAYYNLGRLYKDIGRKQRAFEVLIQATQIEYNFREVHFLLADLYRDTGAVSSAVVAYDQAVRLTPQDNEVYRKVVLAYKAALEKDPKNKEYRRAQNDVIHRYIELINRQPQTAEALYHLGNMYQAAGVGQRAISAYQMAIQLNPKYHEARYALAGLYQDIGRLQEATTMYQESVTSDPEKSASFLQLGDLAGRQKDYVKAKEYYKKAIDADPQNAKAFFHLGFISETEGRLQEAVDLYSKAVSLDPQNAEAYYNLGNVYAALQMNEKAVASYKKAVKAGPNHLNAWINLSILTLQVGDYENAAKYFEEAELLGYEVPTEYKKAVAPYRKRLY